MYKLYRMKNLKESIRHTIREFLNESENKLNLNKEFIDDLRDEISQYESSEQLLRSGGLSIETLDRLAHGFSQEDITQLMPEQLKIRWKDDLDNVKWEIEKSGLTPKKWASKINLIEPIDVSYMDYKNKRGFYIEDGHHRYMAAKILKKPLNVNLEIEVNPIKTIAPDMGYDEFHRHIFDMYKN